MATQISNLLADPARITHLSGESNYAYIHFVDGAKVLTCYTLKALEERLPSFVRVHRSYSVNPDHMQEIDFYDITHGGTVKVAGCNYLPIARAILPVLVKQFGSLVAMVILLTSCMTYEKAKRRYATTVVDTVYTTVTSVVPRDSAVLRLVTDTTTIVKEVRQGRARIIYERTPQTTLVRADCDSVVIEKRIKVPVPGARWGVDPKYQTWADRWKTAFLVLAGLVLAALAAFFFLRKFEVKRRDASNAHNW